MEVGNLSTHWDLEYACFFGFIVGSSDGLEREKVGGREVDDQLDPKVCWLNTVVSGITNYFHSSFQKRGKNRGKHSSATSTTPRCTQLRGVGGKGWAFCLGKWRGDLGNVRPRSRRLVDSMSGSPPPCENGTKQGKERNSDRSERFEMESHSPVQTLERGKGSQG